MNLKQNILEKDKVLGLNHDFLDTDNSNYGISSRIQIEHSQATL